MSANQSAIGDYSISGMEPRDAPAVGRLYQTAIPEAIFARLGDRFTARFMSWIHEQPQSKVWVARDAAGAVVGVIAGTLDRPGIYGRIVAAHKRSLALSTIGNLWRPKVFAWVSHAVLDRLRGSRPAAERSVARPPQELLVIAVTPETKGTGLAERLVREMEAQFRDWGFRGDYTILTLSTNGRSNAFYQRIGAKLMIQVPTRGMLVNEYHKPVGSP